MRLMNPMRGWRIGLWIAGLGLGGMVLGKEGVAEPAKVAVVASLPEVRWTPVFEGVSRWGWQVIKPLPMRAVALRIDLKAPGISFLATPDNGPAEGETDGLKTSSFLKAHRLQAAINAAPFAPVVNEEGVAMQVSGYQVAKGRVVSPPPKSGMPALALTKQNRAVIASPPFAGVEGVWNAVSGFGIVLRKGEVVEGGADRHPRTAVGVSADGRWMVWLVVDGRQLQSVGATTVELGHWLKALGCSEGINLDGGGTSTLVMDAGGGPRVLNTPIHRGIPGTERPSGSHLGLYAKPLPRE